MVHFKPIQPRIFCYDGLILWSTSTNLFCLRGSITKIFPFTSIWFEGKKTKIETLASLTTTLEVGFLYSFLDASWRCSIVSWCANDKEKYMIIYNPHTNTRFKRIMLHYICSSCACKEKFPQELAHTLWWDMFSPLIISNYIQTLHLTHPHFCHKLARV